MDFLENAVQKAKEVFDVAYTKTESAVNTQKQKFDLAAEENKLNKDFARLGKYLFEERFDDIPKDGEGAEILASITDRKEKIAEIKKEINSAKNKRICPSCAASISDDAVFCSNCGAKLTFGSDNDE